MNVMNIKGRRFWFGVSCTVGLCSLVVVSAFNNHDLSLASQPQDVAVGARAPDFALSGDNGKLYRLARFRGKRVLLNFFCSCSRCRALAPEWERVHRSFADVAVLGITALSPTSVKQFRQATHFTFPVLFDANSSVAGRYESLECPRSWVIDERGQVTYASHPGDDLPAVTYALRRQMLSPTHNE
jgi:peroxiredoxin